MSMTDPIADLLTRIRNACMAGHRTVDVPASLMKESVLKVLEKQGYINGFQAVEDVKHPTTRIYIKYYKYKPVIQHLKRISKPGLRTYVRASEIKRVRGGLGISVLSTPQGVMTGREARNKNVGGEVIAEIW
jgi:small subunit ribosomal protein S8